jgi:hypothetical protein
VIKTIRYKSNTITGSGQRIKESEDPVWKPLCRINGVPCSGETVPGFRGGVCKTEEEAADRAIEIGKWLLDNPPSASSTIDELLDENKRPLQICPLCLETKSVVSSHLIPKRMYEYCRPPVGNPISVTTELVIETSRQLQDYLLCVDCEDLLNKGGETWLLPLLAQYQGPFPFYDLLTKFPAEGIVDDVAVYAGARNPEIQVEQLIHFAMGVFWKAGAHSWSGSRTEPMIDLAEHEEAIRKFLRGEAGFPDEAALTMGVLPSPVKQISFHSPYRGSNEKWMNFLFYVPGIEFSLCVGKDLDSTLREGCFARHPTHPILVFDFSPDIREILRGVVGKAHKASNVAKYLRGKS